MHKSRRRRLRLVTVGLVGLLAITLAGCGSSSASSSAGGPSSARSANLTAVKADLGRFSAKITQLPSVTPVKGATGLRGKSVWWVPLGTQVDASFGPTLAVAMTKLGLTLHTCDGKFLPTTVAGCLQQAGAQGANAVITGYVDYKAVPTAFDALAAKGIPVLLAGSVNDSGKTQSAKFAFADTTTIAQTSARLQLESAIVGSGGHANILWVGFTDSAALAAITPYAKTFVARNCAGCTFKTVMTDSAALGKLSSQVGAELVSNPNTNYVVVQIDPGVPLVMTAIQTVGAQAKVKVIGDGALPDTMLTLQKGGSPLVAEPGVSLSYEAWAFAQSLVQMLTGIVPPAQVTSLERVFTTANSKDLSITPAEFGTVDWYADNAAVTSSFTHAWGVN